MHINRTAVHTVCSILALQVGLVSPALAFGGANESPMLRNGSIPTPEVSDRQLRRMFIAVNDTVSGATVVAPEKLEESVAKTVEQEATEEAKSPLKTQDAVAVAEPPAVDLEEPVKDDKAAETVSDDGVIVIDNDEAVETEATIKYEDLPTDDGKTHVKTGAHFPVVISSEINSRTAKVGDPIEARLKYDLKIGDRLVAKKGSTVTGHLKYVMKARTTMGSIITVHRFYRNSGVLGIAFDEIINENGEHLPLVATPARQARIVKNKGEGRVLGVNHCGEVTGPWSQQLKYKAVRVGLNFALAPAGVFSFGAMPAALGVMGAINPSFAFMKPVGLNVRHRRIKGFLWGALSGVPGSFLIEDTTVRGQEAIIKPGDEFLAEFKQEFTGEPASDAALMPGAATKVHGQVVPAPKKGTKS